MRRRSGRERRVRRRGSRRLPLPKLERSRRGGSTLRERGSRRGSRRSRLVVLVGSRSRTTRARSLARREVQGGRRTFAKRFERHVGRRGKGRDRKVFLRGSERVWVGVYRGLLWPLRARREKGRRRWQLRLKELKLHPRRGEVPSKIEFGRGIDKGRGEKGHAPSLDTPFYIPSDAFS